MEGAISVGILVGIVLFFIGLFVFIDRFASFRRDKRTKLNDIKKMKEYFEKVSDEFWPHISHKGMTANNILDYEEQIVGMTFFRHRVPEKDISDMYILYGDLQDMAVDKRKKRQVMGCPWIG